MQIVTFLKTEEVLDRVTSLFKVQKKKLLNLFPKVQIEHVGSTSIPGTITRGDLDMNIRMAADDFDRVVEKLKTLYDINQPENWDVGFASFKDDSLGLGIQVTVIGSLDDHFIAQREYLRNHPEMVVAYNNLKRECEGGTLDDYQGRKNEFFEKIAPHLT